MAASTTTVHSNANSENSNHEENDIEMSAEILSDYTGNELVNELKAFPKAQWEPIISRLPERAVESFPACKYCINGTPHGGASADPESNIRMMLSCRHGSIIADKKQGGRGRSRKNRRSKSRKQRYSRRR